MTNNLNIDLEPIREKYRHERDRRIRIDGQDQYITTTGAYAAYSDDDPYVTKFDDRAPLLDEVTVLIVGGGFAGLLAGAKLKEAGLTDLRIVEAGGDFGGTWYWNRYPGAQCDLESYCYLPLLEETGYIPKHRYSFAPEIYEHVQRIGNIYKLYDNAVFQTRVEKIEWDDSTKFWNVSTNRGDNFRARFVLCAPGIGTRPKLPGIPGLDTFKGKTFHTARWDYAYTGGDNSGNLTKLADKKVGIIGTGATAIQCVPFLGEYSKHLYVFQRTPSPVDSRDNNLTDPEWAKQLKPGWQRERQDNFDTILSGKPFEVDLIQDKINLVHHKRMDLLKEAGPDTDVQYVSEVADYLRMEELRNRVTNIVKDPATAELLKPWYRHHCKRQTFNDDYLETFNRPNVTLVDTSASLGVEKIGPHAIVANGKEYEIDCLIFATGFEFNTTIKRRIGFEIFGRGGESIYDHWSDGLRTLHGHSTHGFPNWFFVGATQSPVTLNYMGTCTKQAEHIAYIINRVNALGYESVEVKPEAEEDWVQEIIRLAQINNEFWESCTPGYRNNEGQSNISGAAGHPYMGDIDEFDVALEQWREAGNLEGMALSRA